MGCRKGSFTGVLQDQCTYNQGTCRLLYSNPDECEKWYGILLDADRIKQEEALANAPQQS